MHFQQRSDRSSLKTLGGTRPMHANSAALKGTDLVALWFAPAAFALDETLPPSTFAIGLARRAITRICLNIVRSRVAAEVGAAYRRLGSMFWFRRKRFVGSYCHLR